MELIAFVVFTVWISGQTSYYDESNTFTYEGALSAVDCYTERTMPHWFKTYYTLCFTDGQRFPIPPVAASVLLDDSASRELNALPKGTKVTVIAYQESGSVRAFWTDEYTFISLDDYNSWSARNKLYLILSAAGACFLLGIPLEVFCNFDAFRQLRISLGKQRRKAKRKQLRSELKNPRKKP